MPAITFTGFVFSILLLAVQFGSSQFSPRMLRRFLRDPTTKISLGVFIATFIYALLVLRTIGAGGNEDFVPNNAISIALLLLLASTIMFLRLISRTTQGLRVAAVLSELGRDGVEAIRQVYREPDSGPGARDATSARAGPPTPAGWSPTTTSRGSSRAWTLGASSRSPARATPCSSCSSRSATLSCPTRPCSASTATRRVRSTPSACAAQ